MAILIDSSALITLERQALPWRDLLEEAARLEPLAIAAITASELLAGVHRAQPGAHRSNRQVIVEELLDMLNVLPFDIDGARIHARVWSDLTTAGQRIGANDLLIAATALAHGYAVLTENVREFSRVPGLEVRQPAW